MYKNQVLSLAFLLLAASCSQAYKQRQSNSTTSSGSQWPSLYPPQYPPPSPWDSQLYPPPEQQESVEPVPWHLKRLSAGHLWKSGSFYITTYDQVEAKRESIVYLLDTGVDSSCPSFEGRVRKGESYEPLKERSPDQTAYDLHGRGTFIAGLITSNDFGVSNSTVIGIKIADRLGSTTSNALITGINYALNLIRKSNQEKIATICIPDPQITKDNYIDMRKLNELITANAKTPFVLSAGNQQSDFKFDQDNAIVVGAINESDGVWEFSNRGSAKFFAPGVAVKSNTASSVDRYHKASYRTGTEYATGIVCGLSAYFQSLDLNDEPVWKLIDKYSITKINSLDKIVQNRA